MFGVAINFSFFLNHDVVLIGMVGTLVAFILVIFFSSHLFFVSVAVYNSLGVAINFSFFEPRCRVYRENHLQGLFCKKILLAFYLYQWQ